MVTSLNAHNDSPQSRFLPAKVAANHKDILGDIGVCCLPDLELLRDKTLRADPSTGRRRVWIARARSAENWTGAGVRTPAPTAPLPGPDLDILNAFWVRCSGDDGHVAT